MKISHLFTDPLVRALIEEAERDEGSQMAVAVSDPQPPLSDDAASLEFELA